MTKCIFLCFSVFNVNLRFSHVFTSPNISSYIFAYFHPLLPNFQFLEITLMTWCLVWFDRVFIISKTFQEKSYVGPTCNTPKTVAMLSGAATGS